MKIVFAVCTTLIILSVSCKKYNQEVNIVPLVTDTVKPPVIKVDTSTLLKSNMTYNYDASGTVVTDSSLTQWKYDDQRRVVSMTSEAGGYQDTAKYTYLNDHYTVNTHISYNGSVVLISNDIIYQHLKNRTDSIISTSTGYGAQAGNYSSSEIYFYYNQANQDSLEKTFVSNNGAAPIALTLNYFYTGANLDSTVARDSNGYLTYVRYFKDGNETTFFWFSNGVQAGVEQFTYTNILTGGIYIVYRNAKLMSGYTSISIAPTTTFTETDTYQMDSANRVTAMLIYRNSSSLSQKQVFSYY
jgi:YD repeat-containing protein